MRWFALGILGIVVGFVTSAFHADDIPARSPDLKRPVILLTGFEPFGPERPLNPSWEGISRLNDTEWNGYQIIARELPVIWGEPQKLLTRWVEQYKPVAVFSFGQGLPGSFALESVASNTRGNIPDNSGNSPPSPQIASDGPPELKASLNLVGLEKRLKHRGHAVRLSAAAGRYLCEETLYSLELLHSQHPDMAVAFSHVPPLNSKLDGQTVNPDLVSNYVLDFLQAWHEMNLADPSADHDLTPICSSQQTDETAAGNVDQNLDNKEIEAFINEYFKSWSEQRMKDYGNCFADGAVIQEISREGDIFSQLKDPFVAGQTAYHKTARQKAVEVPVETIITREADLARAVVYWKLTAGLRIQFGYDHFTLMKRNGRWRILNLVFYGVPERPPGNPAPSSGN